jgi:hypothetical protein
MSDDPDVRRALADPGVRRVLVAREAVSSVALSHPDDCDCVACKASAGDSDALARILVMLEDHDV